MELGCNYLQVGEEEEEAQGSRADGAGHRYTDLIITNWY